MVEIKKLVGFILALTVIITAVNFGSQAVVIDGYDKNDEWYGATVIGFTDNNNGVDIGILSCIIDDRFNAYFRLQLHDSAIDPENTKAGFVLCIQGEKVLETVAGECITVNNSNYSTQAKSSFDSQQGLICEVKAGIKAGIGEKLVGTICFVDAEGIGSNVYPFEIDNTHETEPSEETRETTSRAVTTRRTTTRRETTRRETTRRATTTKRTTTREHTALPASEPAATARYETVVVYVNGSTEPSTTVADTVQTDGNTSVETTIALIYYATSPAEAYSKGKKMKIAVCAASGVAFVLLAAWGGFKMGKNDKKPEENGNDKSDND